MAKEEILVDDGIYFRPRNDGGSIQFLHFATGEISTIAKMASGSFHISPDRRSILYTKTERVDRDMMLVENFQRRAMGCFSNSHDARRFAGSPLNGAGPGPWAYSTADAPSSGRRRDNAASAMSALEAL